jgi:hypothetical protein
MTDGLNKKGSRNLHSHCLCLSNSVRFVGREQNCTLYLNKDMIPMAAFSPVLSNSSDFKTLSRMSQLIQYFKTDD